MKITILIDNIKDLNLQSEWGFCVHINDNESNYLLDTGSSNLYYDNASKLGINISDIDYAVLSHAHCDHSGGYDSFFKNNQKAKLYINKNSKENKYFKLGLFKKYIGVPKNMLNNYKDRIVLCDSITKLGENAYVMSHKYYPNPTPFLFVKENNKYICDNFDHEQNLIFDTPKGLVVLNSCGHIGLDLIIKEVNEAFPDKKVYMFIGGLHLVGRSTKYLKDLCQRIKDYDIDYIYTGHCTKNKAYRILNEELGDKVIQVKCGMEINI